MKSFYYALFSVFFFLGACGTETQNESAISESEEVQESTSTEGSDEQMGGAGQDIREDQRVFFVNLSDGDVVNSPFIVEMGVEGMTVEPAGKLNRDFGHHHILINRGAYEVGVVVPMDESNIHFGQGQTQTTLELEPGAYMLTLQFADGLHQSYGPAMSASINITVE